MKQIINYLTTLRGRCTQNLRNRLTALRKLCILGVLVLSASSLQAIKIDGFQEKIMQMQYQNHIAYDTEFPDRKSITFGDFSESSYGWEYATKQFFTNPTFRDNSGWKNGELVFPSWAGSKLKDRVHNRVPGVGEVMHELSITLTQYWEPRWNSHKNKVFDLIDNLNTDHQIIPAQIRDSHKEDYSKVQKHLGKAIEDVAEYQALDLFGRLGSVQARINSMQKAETHLRAYHEQIVDAAIAYHLDIHNQNSERSKKIFDQWEYKYSEYSNFDSEGLKSKYESLQKGITGELQSANNQKNKNKKRAQLVSAAEKMKQANDALNRYDNLASRYMRDTLTLEWFDDFFNDSGDQLTFDEFTYLAEEFLNRDGMIIEQSSTFADGSTFSQYTYETNDMHFEVVSLNLPVIEEDTGYEWLYTIEGYGLQIRHAHYDTGELTLALESDVEQSVVRGDALFWKWLVEKRHNSVVAVDGRVHSSIPEVDTKPEDWEETIWGTDPSDPEVFMYVASILMDVAPVAGTVKSVIELFTGRDLITNEEIPLWLAAGGVIGSFVPGGKGAVKRCC